MILLKTVNFIALIAALALSACAAYFSVIGLMEIFSASPQAIMIMAIVLETTKVVTAYWAHINWNILPRSIKYTLSLAVLVLMGITSLGISGFLFKAHIQQNIEISSTVGTDIKIIDAQLEAKDKQIQDVQNQINTINKVIQDASDKGYVTKALQLNKKYDPDKQKLFAKIDEIEQEKLKLEKEKVEKESEKETKESKVGPLKYIANLVYGETNSSQLERAVRIMVVILVVVFDPLAILLLIGTAYIAKQQHTPSVPRPAPVVTRPIKKVSINQSNGTTTVTEIK